MPWDLPVDIFCACEEDSIVGEGYHIQFKWEASRQNPRGDSLIDFQLMQDIVGVLIYNIVSIPCQD
jgi:hypothetical protein